MWQNAMIKHCLLLHYEECGWIHSEKYLTIKSIMFDGSPTPLQVEDIILSHTNNEFDNNNVDDNDDENIILEYNEDN